MRVCRCDAGDAAADAAAAEGSGIPGDRLGINAGDAAGLVRRGGDDGAGPKCFIQKAPEVI